MVVALGTIGAAAAIAKQDGPFISSPSNRQPPLDGFNVQNIHHLFSREYGDS